MAATDRYRILGDPSFAIREREPVIGGPIPFRHLVRKAKPDVSCRIIHHGPNHPWLFAKGLGLIAPGAVREAIGAAAAGCNPWVVVSIGGNEYHSVQVLLRIMQRRESFARGPPKMEITRSGRPDGSVMVASNADRLACAGETGDGAVASNMGERQAAVSSPYGTLISGRDAKLMLLRRRKTHRVQRRSPKLVEAGICRHPGDALAIDQHLPDGVGTKPLHRREAFAWSRFQRHGHGPVFQVLESLHAPAGYHPHGTIRSEAKVSELSGSLAVFSRWPERRSA